MKRKVLIYIFSMSIVNNIVAQLNLVPNSSFEYFLACPPGTSSNYYEPYPWFNPTLGTPDYFNQCNNSGNGQAGVPCNWIGCQDARTGLAYSGIGSATQFNIREYISVKLTTPLVAGKKYCVEIYVSLAGESGCSTSSLGIVLSVNSLYSTDGYNLPFTPQIENPQGNFLNDTLNWMLISDTYIAIGNEKYLTIGNFYPDSLTELDTIISSGTMYYYYIDDVSVYCCDADSCVDVAPELFIPTAFSPNGEGNNDFWRLPGTKPESMELSVYDRWGNEVFRTTDPNFTWDGTYKGEKLDAGVFFYYMNGLLKGKELFLKGNLTLVR